MFSHYFFSALLTFMAVSSYALAMTLYLTGLHPNILLYNARVFLLYILTISPVLVLMIFLSMWSPFLLVLSPALLPLSLAIIRKGCAKWESMQQSPESI